MSDSEDDQPLIIHKKVKQDNGLGLNHQKPYKVNGNVQGSAVVQQIKQNQQVAQQRIPQNNHGTQNIVKQQNQQQMTNTPQNRPSNTEGKPNNNQQNKPIQAGYQQQDKAAIQGKFQQNQIQGQQQVKPANMQNRPITQQGKPQIQQNRPQAQQNAQGKQLNKPSGQPVQQSKPSQQQSRPPQQPNRPPQQPNRPPQQPNRPPQQQNRPPQQQNGPPQQQNRPAQQQNGPPQQQNRPPQKQNRPPQQQNRPPQQQNRPPQQQIRPPQQQNQLQNRPPQFQNKPASQINNIDNGQQRKDMTQQNDKQQIQQNRLQGQPPMQRQQQNLQQNRPSNVQQSKPSNIQQQSRPQQHQQKNPLPQTQQLNNQQGQQQSRPQNDTSRLQQQQKNIQQNLNKQDILQDKDQQNIQNNNIGQKRKANGLGESSDSDSDDIPLNQRFKMNQQQKDAKQKVLQQKEIGFPSQKALLQQKQIQAKQKQILQQQQTGQAKKTQLVKKSTKSIDKAADKSSQKRKRDQREPNKEDKSDKWQSLEHSGVLFPPEYEPHGIKMKYDGQPITLTAQEEEVATMYASMIETDYASKPQFNKNFWDDFRKVLGKNHVIKSLEKCNFRPIYEHLMAEREAKKNLPKEEKVRIKEEKDASEAHFKVAIVDGRQENVGNFRVEPPGLFRGRGEHPKMGKIKRRIFPYDITINIGKGAPIPQHPYKGMSWKEVRHDNTVTWLAFWKDSVNDRDFKYVWLAANSQFKTESDLQKYEKARRLKGYVDKIRSRCERDFDSKDIQKRQMAVALYFIDRLALRAGHEKEDDEADTVGCCSLKVENVECLPPNQLKFDFLGKDSIRYENQVEVEPKVFRNVQFFSQKSSSGRDKKKEDQLFDTFDATDLNNELKTYSEELSVKVFRTYNASITLDRLLYEKEDNEDTKNKETVDARKADYDRANKDVAILCNHQRAVPKTHENQMVRMQDKLAALKKELNEIEVDYKRAKKGLELKHHKKGTEESLKAKLEKKQQQLDKAEVNAQVKEDLKTVALGTSKINYMDPRITVAWCKRNDVPMEKCFNKSLLSKFFWAMDADPNYKF